MQFEAFLTADKGKPKKWLRITYTLSIGLHAVLLAGAAVYSFWHVEELTPPSVPVTFMSAAAAAPPPPPPAKKKTITKVKPHPTEIVQPKPDQIVQPKEKPEPEEEPDDGVEGGVEGGVPGGTVGGDVASTQPAMLTPNVGAGQAQCD